MEPISSLSPSQQSNLAVKVNFVRERDDVISACQVFLCEVKVTEDDDQNIRQGEGDEIVVHGAVQTLALDDHHDDGQIAQQTRDEDDQVKYCHRPQKSLVITSNMMKQMGSQGTQYMSVSGMAGYN